MNLLIVDDQPSVLTSLLSVIDWQEIGITDVFAASSAMRAREILQSQTVHILMTDIEMPVESGLSLIRWVREQKWNIECILLTSHADFFYAKQAINLEVFEYILQPAKKEDILRAVENAKLRLDKKLELENITKINEINSNLQNAVIRHMFEQWPQASLPHDLHSDLEKSMNSIRALGIDCTPETQVIYLGVCITRWFTLPIPPSDMLMKYQNQLSEFLSLINGKALSYCTRTNCFVSAVFLDQASEFENDLPVFQKRMLKKLQVAARIYYCTCTFFESAEALNTLYGYLEDTMTDLHTEGDGSLICIPLRNEQDAAFRISSNIKNYYKKIEQFIDQNISAPITRMQIAEYLHLSPDYVSHIVRITTGGSCKELIIRKKMSLARQLLRTTHLPIGEVAARCGYDNFAYFSRVYKNYYNAVPSSERS